MTIGVQLISDGNKCLFYDSSGDKNVEASGCSEADNKLWYFDSSDRLKTEQDNRCIDYHYGTSNYYMHNCHSGQNQKFYWDGKHLRDKYDDDFCMDYHVANGNVRSGTCQDKQNNQWTFEGGAMLKKSPIPTSFSHGQTLEVSCWSERFSSTGSDKLSCVAGSWVNSRGSLGLEGFSCKACVQVVSPKYADLDSQIRQELFFAAGLKLHLTVDTRTVRTVTATGGLRTGGTKDVFVAELMDGAGETLRRFRSITSSGNCLAEVGGSLTAEACTSEAEPTQLMEASELSSLLWEEYKGIPFQVILLPIEHAFVLIGGTCRHLGGSCKHGLKEGLRKHAENLKENQLLPLQWLNARSRTSLLGVDMSANLIEL
ncbi:unnamed protein product [Effrenium voratum]|nr:unnamed protein product [Effrenium voratum]